MKRITTTRIIAYWLFLYPILCSAQNNTTDSLALVALHNTTNGPNWTTAWNLNQPMNTWHGVSLNTAKRVSSLNLYNNQLVGHIPPQLGNLSHLTSLKLSRNQLSGNIPNTLGNLSNLIYLELERNQLSGSIPVDLGNLNNLGRIDLEKNQLTGSIPKSLSNLNKLSRIFFSNNKLSGNIPPELGNLSSLEYLWLGNNQLTGSIPTQLGNLTYLVNLKLNNNKLSGNIPTQLGNLSKLISLDLRSNELTGAIPSTLSNLNNITNLTLNNNQLTGNIPAKLGSLNKLSYFSLASNKLSGSIPVELGNLSNLAFLYLNSNQLTGNIPFQLGDLSKLLNLQLNNNQLTGAIPASLGNLIKLSNLYLNDNQLTGNIPNELGNLIKVTYLQVQNNQLSGAIPTTLANLTKLKYLRLERNQLSGKIPAEFGNLSNLTHLRLHDNQLTGCYDDNLTNLCPQLTGSFGTNTYISNGNNFNASWEDFCNNGTGRCMNRREQDSLALVALYNATNGPNWTTTWNLYQPMDTWHGVSLNTAGQVRTLYLDNNQLNGHIPTEIGNLSHLTFLKLNRNKLSGNIPPELGNLSNLQYLWLDNNQLSGSIPIQLGNLSKLGWLSLEKNQLSGSIPKSIGNLTKLSRIFFSKNKFSGSIPPELGNLSSLQYLWLDNNQLIGTIPAQLGNLTNLINLRLNDNNLSGSIPTQLGNLYKLKSLYLNSNELTGSIPSSLSNLSDITHLTLGGNQLTGNIPAELGSLNKLSYLSLSLNQLTGSIPIELGNLNNLAYLYLSSNQLTGKIPSQLGKLDKLLSLCLNNNQLSGTIPASLDNLIKLSNLYLNDNQLSGTIPNELGNLSNVAYLQLQDNQLTGAIPTTFTNLTKLTYLRIEHNQLSGTIPTGFGSLSNLTHLRLHDNQLSGNIPATFANLTKLTDLRLERNQLSGTVPNIANLSKLDLVISNNKFSHQDIYTNYATNNTIKNFSYSPQYHGKVQSRMVKTGDDLTLTLSEALPDDISNVMYQWKKNNFTLAGKTKSTLNISNLQTNNVGKYTLHITDPTRVPDLEVISEPIYVIISGYDLVGQLVQYNQLILEFDDWQDKENYETKHLLPNAAVMADSCSCNRLLYLWEFPNDSITFQTLLDINVRRQSQIEEAEIDGSFNNNLNIGLLSGGQGRTWNADYLNSYPDEVTVYMLDSGTDINNWNATPYLMNNAPVDDCYGIDQSAGYDYTHESAVITNDFSDPIGHGTYGTRAVAEGTDDFMNLNIVPLKVFNEQGQGTLFDFICGLYHAIDHDADIINVSAGYSGQPSSILENAIALAHDKGQFIVTAAGNDGVNIDNTPQYPAHYAAPHTLYTTSEFTEQDTMIITHYDNVISVASISAQDTPSAFSNYGNNAVTLSAYGENMGGYSHTGENVMSSGSSMSAYYVTRQLAVEMAKNKSRTYQQIWRDFENSSLRNCPATSGFTSTGKCLDIHLNDLPSCRQIDSLALVALYDATDGANWTNTWDLTLPMETWYGVTLNGNGCVKSLIISDNNLNGNIPPEIGYLNNLYRLHIAHNSGISGNIPPEIGYLTNLVTLYLDHNNLTGNIPSELGNLDKLRYLWLHDNQLNGTVPSELGDIQQMILLLLYNNQLNGCFDDNLTTLCSQLGTYSINTYISKGNNFIISWEDFCNGLSCGNDKIEQNQEIDTHNYPNPFTDYTTIEYTLPKDSPVTLTIYSASGKEIALIHHNEMKIQGKHTATFEGGLHPTGMYYYTIQAGEYFGTQKIILMK